MSDLLTRRSVEVDSTIVTSTLLEILFNRYRAQFVDAGVGEISGPQVRKGYCDKLPQPSTESREAL